MDVETNDVCTKCPTDELVPTTLLRDKIRKYSQQHREKLRANKMDALRFGLGEMQAKVEFLHYLTEKDVSGLAARIKRRKHATKEDMYRLCHAFLLGIENIRVFAKITGAMQVLIKELTSNDSEHELAASECLCNLSLGEVPVCEKIATMAGSYFVTYLDAKDEHLKRTSLWTLANILASEGKPAQMLMQMELVPKLWNLYTAADSGGDAETSEDAAICLQIISSQAKKLLRTLDLTFIEENLETKNPTCAAAEYHLQIIFNCDIVRPDNILSQQQLIYLINFCLRNLTLNAGNMQEADYAGRLRLIYAVRVCNNLISTQPMALNMLHLQMATVWQTNLVQIFNELFAIPSDIITKETLWFLQTLISQENLTSSLQYDILLNKLRIPQANATVKVAKVISGFADD